MPPDAPYDVLTDLRIRAQDAAADDDPASLLALADRLRAEDEWWPTLWAVPCAINARRLGRSDARAYLNDASEGGFCQRELNEPEFTAAFSREPDWDTVLERIAANVPPPPIELLSWPPTPVHLPLGLFRLPPEREELLRQRIPVPQSSAWATARALLEWAMSRWRHGNNEGGGKDSLALLDAAEQGMRFRCVEYTTVLTQALNAAGLPARRVSLRDADHHFGVGRGHVVSEAWIDDLGSWVVLDGQNGLYWHDDGRPLSLPELLRRHAERLPRPGFQTFDPTLDEGTADVWWRYFVSATAGGTALAAGPLSPIFEGAGALRAERLATTLDAAHPDLGAVGVGLTDVDGRPAFSFHGPHPFAEGHVVDGVVAGPWEPPAQPGERTVHVRVRTRYGVVPGDNPIVYRVS